MRRQYHLGRYQEVYRRDLDFDFLTIARVLRVNHKYGTADIQLLRTGNTVVSGPNNDGKYSAIILQNFANYDKKRNKYWGEITPISAGATVLVAFIDKMKNRPIILGQIHSLDNKINVFPDENMIEDIPGHNRREAYKQLTLYPSQIYKKVDGEGNIEMTFADKSFLAIYREGLEEELLTDVAIKYLDDSHNGFDFKNLTERDVTTQQPYETDFPESQKPSKLLYVHRTSFNDDETTWTKVFFDVDGKFRLTRDNNDNKLTYFEMSNTGAIKLRRQNDSPNHGEGSDYSEIIQSEAGDIILRRSTKDGISKISLDADGKIELSHSSGSYLKIDQDLNLEVTGEVFSDSLEKYVQGNHIVVSPTEPQDPKPHLIWIDTSDVE